MKKWLSEPILEAGVGKAILALVAALVAARVLPESALQLAEAGLAMFALLL